MLKLRGKTINMIEAALVDLSGTLHIEDMATPGAQEAVQRLKAANVKVKYVTNTTKEPLRILHQRLRTLGFGIKQEEIFTSLTAAREVVESRQLRPLLLLEDSAKEDFIGVTEENPNAVVVGLAPSRFNYAHMNEAFRLLLDGAPLIAIHKARYYKKKDGLYLGPGAFVSGLEYASDCRAEVVGKPERQFFLQAVSQLGMRPENTVMIGDDARDDVAGAIDAGMKGILVKTGKYRTGDENRIDQEPFAVCENFSQAVDIILEKKSR